MACDQVNWIHTSIVGLALVASPVVWAQQQLLANQSSIVFVSKQMGVPVEGHFKKMDARIQFNPSKPEAASIAFVVDMASATLGAPETDAELPKSDWFNATRYPQAQFQSGVVKSTGAGKLDIAGKLTIKGVVRELVVPVMLTQNGSITTASGTFVIPRLAFNIGENAWADTSLVANEVQVKFKLTLTGVGKL